MKNPSKLYNLLFLLSFTFFFIIPFQVFAQSWVIHTGQGATKSFFLENRENSLSSRCNLSVENKNCFEKVYILNEPEIFEIFEKSKSSWLEHSIIAAMFTGSSLSWAYFSKPLSLKVLFVTLGAVEVGYAAKAFYNTILIDKFFEEQKLHMKTCGHLTQDFLQRASDLGIDFSFPEMGFTLIKPQRYLKSLEVEKKVFEKTLIYARKNKKTLKEAYQEYFSKQCGLPPTILPGKYTQKLQDEIYSFSEKTQNSIEDFKEIYEVDLKFKDFYPRNEKRALLFLESFSQWIGDSEQKRKAFQAVEKVIVHKSTQDVPYKIDLSHGKLYLHLYLTKDDMLQMTTHAGVLWFPSTVRQWEFSEDMIAEIQNLIP